MSLRRLARRLDRAAERLEDGSIEILRAIGAEVGEQLVAATPVDTGYARANWRPSINVPAVVPISALDPTGAQTAARIKTVSRLARIGDEVWIANNAPYIGKLNQGSSPQAPAGFVQSSVADATQRALSRFDRNVV